MDNKIETGIENEDLYKSTYGLCPDCNEQNAYFDWCKQCNDKRFQQDFHKWTSGNKFIDKFIQDSQLNAQHRDHVLEWIPYNRLINVKYLDKGGFSTVYKSIWLDGPIEKWDYKKQQWGRFVTGISDKGEDNNVKGWESVLKSLDNSSNLNDEFLNEWKYHYDCYTKTRRFIRLYGISQDPNDLNYIIVMNYADNGSLRKYLPNIINFNWNAKLRLLNRIISGLDTLHKSNLVHHDLHDGNILMTNHYSWISDLGLCKPISYYSSSRNEIYGVLPYIAPEVLRGKPYTPASDIYSFSMIMWEFISGIPPFNDKAHDFHLSLSICRDERPEIPEITNSIPKCYINLMKNCWNSDPLKRPTSSEVYNNINDWYSSTYEYEYYDKKNIDDGFWIESSKNDYMKEFWKADKALEQERANTSTTLETSGNDPICQSHPQSYRTSRLLDFTKKLNEILDQGEKEIFDYKDDQNIELHESDETGVTGLSQSIEDSDR